MNGLPTRFDAIIVGAGPAGITAAAKLAEKGFRVLVVERGRGLGSKQVYGGRVYVWPLKQVFKSTNGLPVHRWVNVERISFIHKGNMVTLEYRSSSERDSFTTYLSELVKWIGEVAESNGAIIVDEVRVDRFVVRDGVVVGIAAGSDTLEANYIVDAEGVNRLLLERLGLVEKPSADQLALGVKEVVKLSQKEINNRLGLNDDEGLAWLMVGEITDGVSGGAFIYTNRDTLSLGVVLRLDSAIRRLRDHVSTVIENLRTSRYLSRILEGGDVLEYSAHLTIEDPLSFMPKSLVAPGLLVVGDAAGLLLNTGFTVRGVDFAIYSGYLAAEGIECVHKHGSTAVDVLRECYEDKVRNSFIYRDIYRFRGLIRMLKNDDIYTDIPGFIANLLSSIYSVKATTPTLLDSIAISSSRIPLEKIIIETLRMVIPYE